MNRYSILAGAPEGFDALVIAQKARKAGAIHLHIARDEPRLSALAKITALTINRARIFKPFMETRIDTKE